jgi:hypothetical protein
MFEEECTRPLITNSITTTHLHTQSSLCDCNKGNNTFCMFPRNQDFFHMFSTCTNKRLSERATFAHNWCMT